MSQETSKPGPAVPMTIVPTPAESVSTPSPPESVTTAPLPESVSPVTGPRSITGQCSIDKIAELCHENHDGGALVLFTQPGCPHCSNAREVVTKATAGKISVLEAGVQDDSCATLADKYHVNRTPTMIYFKESKSGKAKEVVRVPVGSRSWEQISRYIERLPEKTRRVGRVK